MDRKEWLKWRHGGIGGSDVPAIMGVSPWKTALQVYEEKIKPEPGAEETNFIQEKGNQAEVKARAMFAALYNLDHGTDVDFAPQLVTHPDLPFMLCSLDGALPDRSEILEIKMQGADDFALQAVPEKYLPQVHHNMFVTGARKCWFVGIDMALEKLKIVEVGRDETAQARQLGACAEFWQRVQDKKAPEPSDRDYKAIKGVTSLMQKWKRNKLRIEVLNDEQETLRAEILKHVDHPRMMCAGVKVIEVAGKTGSIDWEKCAKDLALDTETDFEKYRKPSGKPSVTFKVDKK